MPPRDNRAKSLSLLKKFPSFLMETRGKLCFSRRQLWKGHAVAVQLLGPCAPD